MRGIVLILGVCLATPLLVGQHDAKADEKKHPAMGNLQAIADGQKLFVNSCAGCHGATGQGGRGPNLRQRGAWHPLTDDMLFTTIQKGLPGADMPPTNLPEAQLWQIAAFVRSLTSPAAASPPAGDIAAGEALFWGKAGCSGCHRILGKGGMLGPDLSNIAAFRSVEDLRESIVDPDADGFPRYRGVTAVLNSGRTIQGVARNRSNYSIQIQDVQGNLHLVSVGDVKQLEFAAHSPMPRNYLDRLLAKGLEDIVAYLSRQSLRPYEEPEKK